MDHELSPTLSSIFRCYSTRFKLLGGGLKSYLPLPYKKYLGTGGTTAARYCYSVWLRHMTLLRGAGLTQFPGTVIELGPGDSIGVGLAALLCGVQEYIGLDVLPHTTFEREHHILDELVQLFRTDTPIPEDAELSRLHPKLDRYGRPSELGIPMEFSSDRMKEWVASLHRAIGSPARDMSLSSPIRYLAPWDDSSFTLEGTADLVLTHAVLQDIQDGTGELAGIMRKIFSWLSPGGVASHQIDLRCPGTPLYWNEHWTYPEWQWHLVRGRRPYYVNRVPLSGYLGSMRDAGFEVRSIIVGKPALKQAPRERLARSFRDLPESDFTAHCAYIATVKP